MSPETLIGRNGFDLSGLQTRPAMATKSHLHPSGENLNASGEKAFPSGENLNEGRWNATGRVTRCSRIGSALGNWRDARLYLLLMPFLIKNVRIHT
jgi:hypothetical protein